MCRKDWGTVPNWTRLRCVILNWILWDNWASFSLQGKMFAGQIDPDLQAFGESFCSEVVSGIIGSFFSFLSLLNNEALVSTVWSSLHSSESRADCHGRMPSCMALKVYFSCDSHCAPSHWLLHCDDVAAPRIMFSMAGSATQCSLV